MNKESNNYTIIYAAVMVIIVAIGLAFTSQVLKERQAKNEAVDKMRQILRAANIESTADDADKKYDAFIVADYAIDKNGEKVSDNGFVVEMVEELRKTPENRKYPVFEALIDGESYYILALRGAGLWGPIWGYIALKDDKNMVYGADFSHQGETPGLGAEITTAAFSKQFENKRIAIDNVFKSIAIVKKGKKVDNQDFVDGISGGTITSQGVNDMLFNSLKGYEAFLNKKSKL